MHSIIGQELAKSKYSAETPTKFVNRKLLCVNMLNSLHRAGIEPATQ